MIFSNYTAEQLGRILGISKWVLGVLAVLTAGAGIFNQWLSDRIADLQQSDKEKAQQRLETLELAAQPRSLSDEQRQEITILYKHIGRRWALSLLPKCYLPSAMLMLSNSLLQSRMPDGRRCTAQWLRSVFEGFGLLLMEMLKTLQMSSKQPLPKQVLPTATSR
jgi:hypothetical protein